jgi:hypothetical protein
MKKQSFLRKNYAYTDGGGFYFIFEIKEETNPLWLQ